MPPASTPLVLFGDLFEAAGNVTLDVVSLLGYGNPASPGLMQLWGSNNNNSYYLDPWYIDYHIVDKQERQLIPSASEYLVVMSNLAFLPAIFLLIRYRYHLSALALAATTLISYLYHSCRSYGICVMPYHALQVWDHLFATSVIMVIFLCFVSMLSVVHDKANPFFLFGSFLINGYFISVAPDLENSSSSAQGIANLLYGIFIVWTSYAMARSKAARQLGYVDERTGVMNLNLLARVIQIGTNVIKLEEPREVALLPGLLSTKGEPAVPTDVKMSDYKPLRKRLMRINWWLFFLGWIVGLIGLVFFFIDGPQWYNYTHTAWHTCVGIAFYCIFKCMNFDEPEAQQVKQLLAEEEEEESKGGSASATSQTPPPPPQQRERIGFLAR